MSKRAEHTFTFSARQIAAAARMQADHHEVQRDAIDEIRRTAKIELKDVGLAVRPRLVGAEDEPIVLVDRCAEDPEFPITGAVRVDFAIDYGDGSTYRRMLEAAEKVQSHQADAKRFRVVEALYGSQNAGREYEVDADDVLDLRLDQDPSRGVR